MSRIIRAAAQAPVVYIGQRHRETIVELESERSLRQFFPFVAFVTMPDGSKMIPINEAGKLAKYFQEQNEIAVETGIKEGFEKGHEEGREEARKVVKQFEEAVNNAVNQRQGLLDEARQQVLELVISVARKVTFDAIRVDPEITANMIAKVIDQLVDRSVLKIKVHPDFLPIIEQQRDRFLAGWTSIKDLSFDGDSRVKYGGCFIETPSGDIDARLNSQFEVIQEALLDDGDES